MKSTGAMGKGLTIATALWISLFLFIPCSHAQWVDNGQQVSTGPGDDWVPAIIQDESGNTIVAWSDTYSDPWHVRAQKYDVDGVAQWGAGGVAVSSNVAHVQDVQLVPDGQGGAVVIWNDLWYEGTGGLFIYGQRIGPDGIPIWDPGGVRLGSGFFELYNQPRICLDSYLSSVFVVFRYSDELYIQRVGLDGTVYGGQSGVYVGRAHSSEYGVAKDIDGGALVSYAKPLGNGTSVYYQRFDEMLMPLWGDGGVVVSQVYSGINGACVISAGDGGGYCAWASGYVVECVRIDPGGNVVGGAPTTISIPDAAHYLKFAGGPTGKAYLTWERGNAIFVQLFDELAAPQFVLPGVQMSPPRFAGGKYQSLKYGDGGLVVAWHSTEGVYCQRVSNDGAEFWQPGPRFIGHSVANQGLSIFASEDGSVSLAWSDIRLSGSEVFAQRINPEGFWCNPEPTIAGVNDVPGDEGGYVAITVDASPFDRVGTVTYPVAGYNVWRKLSAGSSEIYEAARTSISGDNSDWQFPAGRVVDTVGARAAHLPDGYWQVVGSFFADQHGPYEVVVPTYTDSTEFDLGVVEFAVTAHATSQSVVFSSTSASGYSVDNLAPNSPKNLTANPTYDGIQVEWAAVSASDLRSYTVYRNEIPVIDQNLGHIVAQISDLSMADTSVIPGQTYYYWVTADDRHGNRSVPAGYVSAEMPVSTYLAHYATETSSEGILVSWSLNANLGESFEAYRSENGGEDFHLLSGALIKVSGNSFHFSDDTAEPGSPYIYSIRSVQESGSWELFRTDKVEIPVLSFTLYPNKPNPFNPHTTISYDLPRSESVELSIYSAAGELVRNLVNGEVQGPGRIEAIWNGLDDLGRQASSGVYFYRINAGSHAGTSRMVLVK